MRRTLFAVLLVMVAAALCVQTQAARADGVAYTVTDLGAMLGALGLPANFVTATGLSQNGRVVGTWDDNSPCHTTQSYSFAPSAPNGSTGTVQNLGNFGGFQFLASGVNNAGQVTATYHDASQCSSVNSFAELWQNGALSPLPTDGNSGTALAINNLGQATGAFTTRAVLWANGTYLPLDDGFSTGHGINAAGHVVGNSNNLPGANAFGDAFLYDGTMHDIGRLPGFDESTAFAINDHDVVAGESSKVNHFSHAVVWSGGTTQDIDCDTRGTRTFPGCSGSGTGSSVARGINNQGQVVGMENQHAFLWDPVNGMVDLDTLLPAGSATVLTDAVAINDAGQILARSDSSALLLSLPGAATPPPRYGSAQLDPSHCGLTKQSRNVVNVSFRMIDDYDSGVHGNAWANDTVHRELRIWRISPTGNTFCATVTDTAKFVTFAGDSPGGSGHVSAGIAGSFVGGEITGQFTGSLVASPPYPTSGEVGPTLSSNTFDLRCTDAYTCPGARPTISSYVNGYDGRLAWWGWQYTTDGHGIWTDSSDGITGDITG
jgi:probable HAF family extracellular repeat protein